MEVMGSYFYWCQLCIAVMGYVCSCLRINIERKGESVYGIVFEWLKGETKLSNSWMGETRTLEFLNRKCLVTLDYLFP